MNVITVTGPAYEPITVDDVLLQLRMTWSDEALELQGAIERAITTAREYAERITRRSLITQTLRVTAGSFKYLELRRPPLISLLSVKYYDQNNALQTISGDYYYATEELVPRVRFLTTYSIPDVADRPDAVQANYTAGYPVGSGGDSAANARANVPRAIRDAMLIHVQMLIDRMDGNERQQFEMARDSLLEGYRIQTL